VNLDFEALAQEADRAALAPLGEPDDDQVNIGHVTRDLNFAGLSFGLRTLYPFEEAAAALATQPWVNTLKAPEMWAMALIGLAITHVNGNPDFCPRASQDDKVYAIQRLKWISRTYHWPVIARLYEEYTTMQEEQTDLIERVENLSEPMIPDFMLSPVFSTGPDISPDEDPGENLS
jgi:hypothetical protein